MEQYYGLMDALELEDLDRVTVLLGAGVSPDKNDSNSFSDDCLPIFVAIDRLDQSRINDYPYDMRLLAALLDAGCDLNVSYRGRTPLEAARESEFEEAIGMLLRRAAQKNF
jgi:hypothetical protein